MLGVAVECWGWQWNVGGGSGMLGVAAFKYNCLALGRPSKDYALNSFVLRIFL
jgi:hypothetical protein